MKIISIIGCCAGMTKSAILQNDGDHKVTIGILFMPHRAIFVIALHPYINFVCVTYALHTYIVKEIILAQSINRCGA